MSDNLKISPSLTCNATPETKQQINQRNKLSVVSVDPSKTCHLPTLIFEN
jgi:hypothetical protein